MRHLGQVGAAGVGRRRQRLGQAGDQVGRDRRQRARGLQARLLGRRPAAGRHARVDLVHQLPEFRVQPVARVRERHRDLGRHPPGVGGQHQDAVAHLHRLLDVVGDDQHRLDRQPPRAPQRDQLGAQGFGGQHVQRGEGFVHQQQRRVHHQRPGESDPLAHAARQLARVGVLEAVEADQVDGRQRPLAPRPGRHAERLQPGLDVLQHREPGKEREGLEDHGHARRRPPQRPALPGHRAFGRRDQAGHDAQQRGLARTGAAQQPDDLAGAQREVHAVEHAQLALGLGEAFADALDAQDVSGFGHGAVSSGKPRSGMESELLFKT